ncbi:MAG: WD40/YVTN/BNR-like repeat-containing protein, partial [Dehalococcoidia bacterium]
MVTDGKSTVTAGAAEQSHGITPSLLNALQWRLIGSFRGGRCVAVAGHPTEPLVFYFGSTGGGVWKTIDGGVTWNNVSDGFFGTASVGALAVSESDPNVIYAGMGECCIRGNVSYGDGIYRSTDGGKSWAHMGLAETRHIARVRIHPRNPELIYVAALGHAFGPNEERGLYRSGDGGRNWEKILYRSEKAGCIDLSMDPHNPRVLYAAFWEAQRTPYSMISGGPGSSIYRSTDGGDSWEELTDKLGLPKGVKGRIGIAVSPARSDRIWALIEAEESGVYRSDDGGDSWVRTSEERELYQRPWYYMHIFADPRDADTIYIPNLKFWKSIDGGKTFTAIPTAHGDNHDLRIDPRDPRRMIESNDGGACVTFNGGVSWSTLYNQPTAEFYHVVTDTRVPYRVYGAQQDNTTLCVPSRSDNGAITQGECYPVGGGESGYIAVRPDNPEITYAGSYGGLLTRYDHRTHQYRNITVWPENPIGWAPKDLKYRFQWTAPIVLSPHGPDLLYTTGNHVFRTMDDGTNWEEISLDLTRNDLTK